MCGHKKLTNTRDPNRDPNRSSACDFLETARLFAARCVCGRCRKEKIEKLQPTIQCAQINIRPPHGQLFILHVVSRKRSVCDIPATLVLERRTEGSSKLPVRRKAESFGAHWREAKFLSPVIKKSHDSQSHGSQYKLRTIFPLLTEQNVTREPCCLWTI